jgi:hypothetical protein
LKTEEFILNDLKSQLLESQMVFNFLTFPLPTAPLQCAAPTAAEFLKYKKENVHDALGPKVTSITIGNGASAACFDLPTMLGWWVEQLDTDHGVPLKEETTAIEEAKLGMVGFATVRDAKQVRETPASTIDHSQPSAILSIRRAAPCWSRLGLEESVAIQFSNDNPQCFVVPTYQRWYNVHWEVTYQRFCRTGFGRPESVTASGLNADRSSDLR